MLLVCSSKVEMVGWNKRFGTIPEENGIAKVGTGLGAAQTLDGVIRYIALPSAKGSLSIELSLDLGQLGHHIFRL